MKDLESDVGETDSNEPNQLSQESEFSKLVQENKLNRTSRFLAQEIDLKRVDVQLTILGLATGILDAMTFPDLSVFVSNQTGNTVLLAVGISKDSFVRIDTTITSLSCFMAGSFCFGQAANRIGRKRRGWLVFSNLTQSFLVLISGILVYTKAVELSRGHRSANIPTALMAFGSGGQVAMARALCQDIPTAMVTSAYVDLFADPDLFKLHNVARNRRIVFIICLFVGSLIGAYTHDISAGLPMMLTFCMKFLISWSFLMNPVSKTEDGV